METPQSSITRTPSAVPQREIATTAAPPQMNGRPSRKSSYGIMLIAGAAVLAIASILVGPRLSRLDSRQSGSVAVLPLSSLGDSITTLAGEAIAEELITNLTQLQGIDVRSSPRSKAVLDSARNVEQIGRQLTVSHVVDGSVQRNAEKLRVNIRLVRVSDASTLWARSLDLDATDLLSSQSQLAAAVVDALAPLLIQTTR